MPVQGEKDKIGIISELNESSINFIRVTSAINGEQFQD